MSHRNMAAKTLTKYIVGTTVAQCNPQNRWRPAVFFPHISYELHTWKLQCGFSMLSLLQYWNGSIHWLSITQASWKIKNSKILQKFNCILLIWYELIGNSWHAMHRRILTLHVDCRLSLSTCVLGMLKLFSMASFSCSSISETVSLLAMPGEREGSVKLFHMEDAGTVRTQI